MTTRKIIASNGRSSMLWKFGDAHSTISRCCASLPWVSKG